MTSWGQPSLPSVLASQAASAAANAVGSRLASALFSDNKHPQAVRGAPISRNRGIAPNVVSTTGGAYENVIWGKNPYPKLERFSARKAAARRAAIEDGVPFVEPISFVDWEFGNIWSASRSASGANWISDNQQGQCRWYAFPCIAPYDVDHVSTVCNGNDNKLTATNIVAIESWINELEFRNAGSEAVEVDVFQCFPREDLPLLASSFITDQYDICYQGSEANVSLLGPDLLTQRELKGYQPVPTGAIELKMNSWDATPFMNPVWREVFACRPYYHRLMAPGDTTRAHFGLTHTMLLDPAELFTAEGLANPVSGQWAYKKEYGPIYLMRVRGTLVHAESTSSSVEVNGTPTEIGEGHPNRPLVNYGNFLVDFAWRAKAICRQIPSTENELPQLGYYGGVTPMIGAQIWDVAHEFQRAPNVPNDYALNT